MDKTAIIIIVIILAAALFFIWYSAASKVLVEPTVMPEGIVLFYGQGCSHCKEVEDFISQNKIEDKVKITRLEVWYNKSNAVLLGQIAQKCGITGDSVGVPFLYDPSADSGQAGKCYIGEVDVPNFLKNAGDIK